jgi:hypothetical protein
MATKNGWLAAVLMVGMAVGCGESGTSGGTPTESQKAAAQNAGTGSSTVAKTQDAANDAIVESGAPGSTAAKSGSQKSYTGGTAISYAASVTLTVNLDVLNDQGQDAFPNATGSFKVTANGTVTGDGMNGQVTYDVHVEWLTDGVFTDPACGTSATIATGSNWNYDLQIQWAKTDDLNWSISASADVAGALNATVTQDGVTWTVTGTVTRHASLSFSRTNGNYAFTFGINGQHTAVVTNGIETHTVVSTMSALDHIIIEVDGVAFGPYTLAQILWVWGYHCAM